MKQFYRTAQAILFASLLMIAFQVVGMLAGSWAMQVPESLSAAELTKQESLFLRDDGTPLIRDDILQNGRSMGATYRTIEGQPFEADRNFMGLSSAYLFGPPKRDPNSKRRFEPPSWSERIFSFGALPVRNGSSLESWYFVNDGTEKGLGYFVGYDRDTKALIGYLGVGGLTAEPPTEAERIAGHHLGIHLQRARNHMYAQAGVRVMLSSGGRVVDFDLTNRRADTIWQGGEVADVEYLPRLSMGKTAPSAPTQLLSGQRLIVRTERRLHILNDKREEDYSVEIPAELVTSAISIAEMPDGILLYGPTDDRGEWMVARIEKSGKSKIVLVQLAKEPNRVEPWLVIGAMMPNPVALLLGLWREMFIRGWQSDWEETFREHWPHFWPTFLAVVILSCGLALWVRRRQRSFGLDSANVWAAFVVLFGPAAVLAYLVHRNWPIREACPACGVLAPRDRDTCFRCEAEFPPPPRLSTEIRG